MNIHWLNISKRKKMFHEIDKLGVSIWEQDGTLGDLFAVLNEEQANYLMGMKLTDFFSDEEELRFGIEIIAEE